MMSIKYSNHSPTSLSPNFLNFRLILKNKFHARIVHEAEGKLMKNLFFFSFRKQTNLKQTQSRSTIFLNCRTNNINNNHAGRTRSWLDGERVASIKLPGAGGHQRPDHLPRHHDQQHIRVEVAADSGRCA